MTRQRHYKLFIIFDLALFFVSFCCYISRVSYFESISKFFQLEVIDFNYEEALFDLVIVSFMRTCLVCSVADSTTFLGILCFFMFQFGYAFVKIVFFKFDESRVLDYVFIISCLVANFVELISWNFFLGSTEVQRKPLLSQSINGENTESSQTRGYETNNMRKPGDLVEVGSLTKDYTNDTEEEFLSADEADDADESDLFRDVDSDAETIQITSEAYTPQEYTLIRKMKQHFPEFPDEKLYRFLVAREMDFERAYIMLENHSKWREFSMVDDILFNTCPLPLRGFTCFPDTNAEDTEPEIKNIMYYNGFAIHKSTRNGLPLVIYPIGFADAKGTADNNTKKNVEKTAIFLAEFVGRFLFPEMSRRTSKPISSIAVIIDLNGLGLRQLYMPALLLFTDMVQLSEDNYPETLGLICVVNAPSIFQMFWKVIKPILPARTLSRIKFLGKDYKDQLREVVAPENLPHWLGGLCNCRNPEGCVPWPKSEGYKNPRKDENNFFFETTSNGEVSIPIAISSQEITLRNKRKQGNLLRWVFKSDKSDVSFTIYFNPNFETDYKLDNLIPILPTMTYQAQNEVRGEWEVNGPGTFIFHWSTEMANDTIRYLLS